MARLEETSSKGVDSRFLSIVFDKDYLKDKLDEKERSKVEVFEKGLAGELSTSDTIEQSVEKIVKMALVCEFGAELTTKTGAKKMISVISRGILGNSELRRSALIIADRFAKTPKSKIVNLRGKGKNIING